MEAKAGVEGMARAKARSVRHGKGRRAGYRVGARQRLRARVKETGRDDEQGWKVWCKTVSGRYGQGRDGRLCRDGGGGRS